MHASKILMSVLSLSASVFAAAQPIIPTVAAEIMAAPTSTPKVLTGWANALQQGAQRLKNRQEDPLLFGIPSNYDIFCVSLLSV